MPGVPDRPPHHVCGFEGSKVKKRRLSDLYVRGREVAPTDGYGEPVKVWLNKLNEIDRETCLRRASAAKARFLIGSDDEDSDAFAAMYAETRDIGERDELIFFLIAEDLQRSRRRIEAEIAADEETWGKEDYLQGLIDAWIGDDENPGLSTTMLEDPDDPEAKRVSDELDRYQNAINAELTAEEARLRKDWEEVDLDVLRRKVAHRLLELRAGEEFIREYRRQQIFFAVREPVDHRKRYFRSVSEVDDLDEELRQFLTEQYESLLVPPLEGKDSPAPAGSSNSPEPIKETPEPSGPEDADD